MGIPSRQKALLLTAKRGDLLVSTIEVPQPEPGEVLVRIEAVGLGHIDNKIQETGVLVTQYPVILGFDAAGIVVAIGQGVTNLILGDRVLFVTDVDIRHGGYQQYAVVKAVLTSKVPSRMSFDYAATIPCNFLTAFNGLYTSPAPRIGRGGANLLPFFRDGGFGKYSGRPIAVMAASSSVGQYVTQLARLSGFSPIIAIASLRNAAFLKSLGATHVIDRTLPKGRLLAQVQHITEHPIELVYDAISLPESQDIAYDILAPGGTLVLVHPSVIDRSRLISQKTIQFACGGPHSPEYFNIDSELFRVLPELLALGEIRPNIPEYLPGGLAAVPEGLGRLKRKEISARKLVIRPPETI